MRLELNLCTFLLSLAVIFSCDKGGETPSGPATGGRPDSISGSEISSTSNLYGRITDTSGNPVAGVSVTDGRTVVATDANGVYQMARSRLSTYVYYTTPAGYEINVDSNGHPVFYSRIDQTQDYVQCDFTLTPLSAPETDFTLLCIADPQCASASNISRFRNETIVDANSTIAASRTPVYAVTLGDIIFDTPDLWQDMKTAMAALEVPIFQTIGNHDHLANSANETAAEANFESYFGPRNYSFDRGNAHIVVMDNIIYTGGAGGNNYRGGISNNQLSWLEDDLALVDKSKLVILCAHIPFRNYDNQNDESYQNASAVLNLLSEFAEAHLMIGHTHYNQNWVHSIGGKNIIEHIHGAACGAWWTSDLCVDGSPNGYGVYEISGSRIANYYYKATGRDKSFQMRAYPGQAVFGIASNITFGWGANVSATKDPRCVVVNVWNAIPSGQSSALAWDVELYQRGTKVCDMTYRATTEWWAYADFVINYGKSTSSGTYKNSRPHIFTGMLSSGSNTVSQSDAELDFEVRVTDQFGNVYTCSTLQRSL